jgi:hypothetical protein
VREVLAKQGGGLLEFVLAGLAVGETLGQEHEVPALAIFELVPDTAETGAGKKTELPLTRLALEAAKHQVGVPAGEPLPLVVHRARPDS